METLEISANEPCPRGIVGQLLEIAKENDAMSEIGGATSWRWQEGIISRMPKTKTVAKILTKAFGTDNPQKWLGECTGDLQNFIKKNFKVEEHKIVDLGLYVDSIYDSIFVLKASSVFGASVNDLIFNFCYFKYAESFKDEDIISLPSESSLLNLYGSWASKKLKEVQKKIPYIVDKEKIKLELIGHNNSEVHTRNIMEIHSLQLKMVGFNSNHDFWSGKNYSLTDDENIKFERELLTFIKNFHEKITLERDESLSYKPSEERKLRHYSFGVITLPTSRSIQ